VAKVSKAPSNYEDPEADTDQAHDAPDRVRQASPVLIPLAGNIAIALLNDSNLVSVISSRSPWPRTSCSTAS
jgi:hypothetical protein